MDRWGEKGRMKELFKRRKDRNRKRNTDGSTEEKLNLFLSDPMLEYQQGVPCKRRTARWRDQVEKARYQKWSQVWLLDLMYCIAQPLHFTLLPSPFLTSGRFPQRDAKGWKMILDSSEPFSDRGRIAGLDDPYGSFPSCDILWFYVNKSKDGQKENGWKETVWEEGQKREKWYR